MDGTRFNQCRIKNTLPCTTFVQGIFYILSKIKSLLYLLISDLTKDVKIAIKISNMTCFWMCLASCQK